MNVEHLDLGYSDEPTTMTKGKRLLVEFFKDAVLNVAKTEANRKPDGSPGAPVFDNKVFVRITHPGRLEAPVFEATEKYQKQFPQEWKRFCEEDDSEVGIPLNKVTTLGRDIIELLKSQKIKYVEQLANLTDDDVGGLGLGARDARDKAKIFLGEVTQVEILKKRIAELEKAYGTNNIGDSKKRITPSGV